MKNKNINRQVNKSFVMVKKMGIFIIVLVLLLAGCSGTNKPQGAVDDPKAGVWNGKVYTNDVFGLTFRFVSGWKINPKTMPVEIFESESTTILFAAEQKHTGRIIMAASMSPPELQDISEIEFLEFWHEKRQTPRYTILDGTTTIGEWEYQGASHMMPGVTAYQFIRIQESDLILIIMYLSRSDNVEHFISMFE